MRIHADYERFCVKFNQWIAIVLEICCVFGQNISNPNKSQLILELQLVIKRRRNEFSVGGSTKKSERREKEEAQ